jgi:large repetitive protein
MSNNSDVVTTRPLMSPRLVVGALLLALTACGGGDSETSQAPGAVVTRKSVSANAIPNAAAAPSQGRWSPVVNLSMVPAAAAVVPSGKVVFWAAETRFAFSAGGRTYTALFDPTSLVATETLVSNTGHNMFCPGTSNLADGRLLVSGGINAAATSIYDPTTNSWSVAAQMNIPRGYQANCVLEDGSVLTLGGSWSGAVGGKDGEVWDAASGWRRLTGVPITPMLSVDNSSNSSFGGDSHFWLYQAGNGRVFHAGPGINMHWIGTRGNGSVAFAGARGDDEFSVNGTAAMYDIGKLLKAGGAAAYEDLNANANAYVIDINTTASVRKLAPMVYPRAYHNSVVLPNGQVMLVGGMTFAKNFTDDTAVLRPELFDPVSETFTLLPAMSVPRTYHSVALLLPDGRVLSAGGGLCGTGCAANHADLQIYTPHYLLNADGSDAVRPVVLSAPTQATHGTRVSVNTDSAVQAFALVRVSSVTHSVNNDQRRVPLAFTHTAGNTYELTIPSNPGWVVPGYYMLFAMSPDGVPSIAKMVRISGEGAPKIVNPNDQSTSLNASLALPISATDATSFSASGLPPGLAMDATTGTITGSPTTAGRYAVTLIAANAVAQTSTTLVWTVGSTAVTARFFRLEALSEINGNPWTSLAEFNLLGELGIPMSRSSWTASADSAETTGGALRDTGAAANAIDGDAASLWHTQWVGANPTVPHWLTIDMGSPRAVTGLRVLPRNDGGLQGIIANWRLLYSDDGVNWSVAASGNFTALGPPTTEKTVLFSDTSSGNRAPTLQPVANQSHVSGTAVLLTLAASDPDGDVLSYAASGLPPGLAIDPLTGTIAGAPSLSGNYNVTVQVADGKGGTASTTFTWAVTSAGFVIDPVPAAAVAAGGTASFTAVSNGGVGTTYSWDFGDGSAPSAPSTSSAAQHAYAAPGLYVVTVTATTSAGTVRTRSFLQAIYNPVIAGPRPTHSSNMALESVAGGNPRLWLVNQDNDTVSVFDSVTTTKLREIAVGAAPRTVAVAPNGKVWVVNKGSAAITVIDPASLSATQTLSLPRGSAPFGLAFAPNGAAAYVTLEATGQLLKLDPVNGAQLGAAAIGADPRHLSISAASNRVLVSRFISPPLPGEATATVSTQVGSLAQGGEVVVVTSVMVVERTVTLKHSDRQDSSLQGSGLPNYLSAAVIAPDGSSAWVPSKQDNIKRGMLRNGANLDFQNSVRAISSRIDLGTWEEDTAARVDHDNSGLGSAAVFHPTGAYLFVALQTSRHVAVINPVSRTELFRFDAGLAPDGLAISADGSRLFVNNFMDRTLGIYDLSRLVNYGEQVVSLTAAPVAVAAEKLATTVLAGKRLFYDARDPRLARDGYLSCASCHNDGGHDGRVWDMTGFGEGLRNTISLRGRAVGHGRLHWTGNFDEVQDFEGQIRTLAGGSGLMSNAQFQVGTRSQPLGDRKTGISADLDALAAYVGSLDSFAPSPYRLSAATPSPAALEGKQVFTRLNCAACHVGTAYTNSASNVLADVGTIKPSSGQRLNGPLTGLDAPTLRDVWATAPYLHDGSASSLEAAVQAHATLAVSAADAQRLAAYLKEIGSDEGVAPSAISGASIWPATAAPASISDNDPAAITVGTKFRSDLNGFITAIRFYKGPNNTGTHIGALWTDTGQQLATVTFTNETASGWQQANLSNPVAITANTVYVVSYFAPRGEYSGDDDYFAAAGVDNGPLHALRDGESGANGVYIYGSAVAFPTQTYRSENYWVDVVFASSVIDTTPPTVSANTPASGASNVASASAVTVTFSEAMDASSINSGSFDLRNTSSGAVVAAAVAYNSSTRVATLTPTTALASGTNYTATVRGGTTDPRVKDAAGNALANSLIWSFATVEPDTTPPTITARTPAANATATALNTTVTVTFSEAIDPTSISSASFELRDSAGSVVTANVAYNTTTRSATLTPATALRTATTYSALVRGGTAGSAVKDLAGNRLAADGVWSFTTTAGDVTPPAVTLFTPASGSTGISRTANITVTFNEAMAATSINTSTFELRDPAGNLVPSVVSYSTTNKRATLNPNPTLVAATTYTVTVRGGSSDPRVKDLAGNAMAANFVWSFKTR